MKKIIYSTALGALLIGLAGCSKSKLNLFPYNAIATQQAFTTSQGVSEDVLGMYAGMKTASPYYVNGSPTMNIVADVLADNLVLNQQGRQSLKSPYYNYTYSSTNTFGLFGQGYSIIRRANAILENIGTFPAGAFRNNATGEAYAVRALVYFDMVRVYSKTYLNATATDFTLPYVTTTDATNLPGSENLQGFYNKIIADLVAAEGLINPVATNTNIHMNKEAVEGLLAKVYLYKGDYANCIAEANKALGTGTPNLPTAANFNNIWIDAAAADGAVLFKVKNTTIDNLNSQGVAYYQFTSRPSIGSTQNGYKSEYLPDYGFYQMYDATDVRKASYFQTNYYNGLLYNNVIKYAGRSGPPELGIGITNTNTANPAGVVDAKVVRTADVILCRMEAEYRSGATGTALTDLQLLKANRYTGYVGSAIATADAALSGAGILTEILKQRRLEMAFENDRFWDLKRLNLGVARSNNGEKADGTGTPPAVLTLAAGDPKFQLPYPQSEVVFNPKITQNPGY